MRKKERQYLEPAEIYRRSFSIIEKEFGNYKVDDDEMLIRTRIAHTTADVEFSKTFQFHPRAINAGIEALKTAPKVSSEKQLIGATLL